MRVMTTAVPGFAAITCAKCDGFKTKTGADIEGTFAIPEFGDEEKYVHELVCLRIGMSVSAMRH